MECGAPAVYDSIAQEVIMVRKLHYEKGEPFPTGFARLDTCATFIQDVWSTNVDPFNWRI